MTTRDDVLTALDSYVTGQQTQATNAANAACDAKVSVLQAQIANLNQQLADCQAANKPTPPTPTTATLHGSACAGWWSGKAGTAKETRQQGTARIVAAFPGVGVWRCWETIPTYLDRKQAIFLDTGAAANQKAITTACLNWNGGVHWTSCWHEPENDNVPIADWQAVQMQAAATNRANGQSRVRYVSLLMGETGIPSRNPPHSAEEWFNFDMRNVDCIGADLYQQGKSDTDCDTAAAVLGPWIALARKKNKPLVIGEFGVRRVAPPWSPGISDAARAKYSSDAIALMDGARFPDGSPVVQACMIYESDSGTSGRLPWNLLPPPGQTSPYSPQAVNVWKQRFAAQR